MKKITIQLITLILFVAFGHSNAQTKSIAFLGQAATYNDNIPDAADGFTYDDDRAAAVWFMEDFIPSQANIEGTYFSFQKVAEGADISGFDLIWIQSDGATWTDRLNEWPRGTTEGNGDRHCLISETGFVWNGGDAQCIALEDAFMASIRDFYKSGGNIFLGNYAGKALEVIGVFDGLSNPWEYRPNQTFGDVAVNPGNTAGAWDTNWAGEPSSELISGIPTSAVTCEFSDVLIEFLGADTEKKNRACQYNLDWGRIYDDAGADASTLLQRRTAFETTLNANILLENCNGNEIQGAKFNPRSGGDGTVIWYGAGTYDWYAPGAGGNDNVKLLTQNTLLSLLNNALSIKDVESKELISVYPNPVNNELFIKSSNPVQVQVYSITGKEIIKTSNNKIDFTTIKSGVYIVNVTDLVTKGSQNFKIVK